MAPLRFPDGGRGQQLIGRIGKLVRHADCEKMGRSTKKTWVKQNRAEQRSHPPPIPSPVPGEREGWEMQRGLRLTYALRETGGPNVVKSTKLK